MASANSRAARPALGGGIYSSPLRSNMSSLATLFDPPIDATPDELRARLRALADLIARAPIPIAVAHDAECRLISANVALARLLGVPTDGNISLTPAAG